jgi:hypothetical protein
MKKQELKQILKEEIQKILSEAKQVGILYHYTDSKNIKNILKNGIKFSPPQQEISNMYYISTTRKKQNWKHQTQITLDGNKISEKYKISPIQASTFLDYDEEWLKVVGVKIDSLGGSELAEERILSKTPGYLSPEYILDIT